MKRIKNILITILVLATLVGCTNPEECSHLETEMKNDEISHYTVCKTCRIELSREDHIYKDSLDDTACTVCNYDPYEIGRQTNYKYGMTNIPLYNNDISVKFNGKITNIHIADDIVFIVCWSPYMQNSDTLLFDDTLSGKAYIPTTNNSTNTDLKAKTEEIKNKINSYANEKYSLYGDEYFNDIDNDGHINETDMFIQSMFENDINYWGIYSFSI